MRCQQIKIKKRHLYSHYCEVIIMQVKSENSVRLSSTLYMSKLKINLLSEKWMCKMKLHKSFDQYCLQMCDKHDKTIIEALEWDEVYIVKYIAKSLNEFALISAVYTLHSEIIFSVTASDISLHVQTHEHNLMINFLDVDTISLNEKIKTYRLWHWWFVHLNSAKLHDLHKMTILEKSIFIVENNKNIYEIYALIKFINKQDHTVSKRKTNILVFIFIDIYSSLFLSFNEYQYFLKIVDNHFWKMWMILLKQHDEILQTLQEWWLKTEL